MELQNGIENHIRGLDKNVWGYCIMEENKSPFTIFQKKYQGLFDTCFEYLTNFLNVKKPWLGSLERKNFPNLDYTLSEYDNSFMIDYEKLVDDGSKEFEKCRKLKNTVSNAINIKNMVDGYFSDDETTKKNTIAYIEKNEVYKKEFPILKHFKGGKARRTRRRKNKKRRSSKQQKSKK